ncbi:hypothetical protein MMC12_008509, partial [Toensbergia leucococca]|nr:hypothetical protein [Toensbergia leucococca]
MITSHTSVIVGQAACLQRPYQLPPFTEPRLLQIEGDCRISNAATINFLSDVPRGPGSIHVHVYGNVYMEAPTKTKGPKSKKGKKGKNPSFEAATSGQIVTTPLDRVYGGTRKKTANRRSRRTARRREAVRQIFLGKGLKMDGQEHGSALPVEAAMQRHIPAVLAG